MCGLRKNLQGVDESNLPLGCALALRDTPGSAALHTVTLPAHAQTKSRVAEAAEVSIDITSPLTSQEDPVHKIAEFG